MAADIPECTSLTLEQINAITSADFVDRFGQIAEHSPWVATLAEQERPFSSVGAMTQAFVQAMTGAARRSQLELICAHPDLAGRAALAGELTQDSMREQAQAGLDQLTPAEFEQFNILNNAYRERFGFPFIFAVKGATKHQILDAFAERLDNSTDEEFEIALTQVARIIGFRLSDVVAT